MLSPPPATHSPTPAPSRHPPQPDNYGTGAGWGNKEEQVYTDNRTNVDVVKHK